MKIKLTSLYLISIFKNILNDEIFTSFIDFLKIMEAESDFDEYSVFGFTDSYTLLNHL